MARSTALTAVPRVAGDRAVAPPLYRALRAVARAVLIRHFDLAVEGEGHLPSNGPYIVAANHHNYLDGIVLGAAVPTRISFLVMPRVWSATPLHPGLHRLLGSIRLELGRPDVGALRRALALLDAGHVVGIFPEGPFSVRGRLETGLPGVALLALRSGVPVVPAGIRGTYEALVGRRFYVPRRRPLAVRFGAPRCFTAPADAPARKMRRVVTDRIMADIAALLS
jgi:1-acyl-sn-glycerol-3-phosphate acyltransferase